MDVENFLIELSTLTNKYRIVIGGCGCCQSPYLSTEEKPRHGEVAGGLEWDKETCRYEVEERRERG